MSAVLYEMLMKCVVLLFSFTPPRESSAQRKYEEDRFRVQPGRIENYSLGRGSLAQQEAQKVNKHHFPYQNKHKMTIKPNKNP